MENLERIFMVIVILAMLINVFYWAKKKYMVFIDNVKNQAVQDFTKNSLYQFANKISELSLNNTMATSIDHCSRISKKTNSPMVLIAYDTDNDRMIMDISGDQIKLFKKIAENTEKYKPANDFMRTISTYYMHSLPNG